VKLYSLTRNIRCGCSKRKVLWVENYNDEGESGRRHDSKGGHCVARLPDCRLSDL
jgi:hypothetical protein